jgi:hypothetical protein
MRSLGTIFGGILFAALCTSAPARAQQPTQPDQPQGQQPDAQQPDNTAPENNPTQPIPAIRSPLAGAANNGQDDTQGQIQPDTNSISGVAPIGLGSPVMTHNYWAPRLAIAGTADSNPNYAVGSNDWTAFVSILGGIDVHRSSGGSDLFLTYTGGGSFTNTADVDSGIIQTLSLKDKFLFHRSSLIVFEQVSYLPETALGFAGASGAGIPGGLGGGTGTGIGTGYTPGQSILTPRGQDLNNSTALEYDYQLSRRGSITLVGSYALLHYFDNDLANFYDVTFQGAYNYQLTRKDTVSASYQFSAIRYSNLGQSINSNVVQGMYGRKVTGRLAFQIGVGPQFVTSTTPITGTTTTVPISSSVSSVSWALNSSLTYGWKRGTLSASYVHGLTGGSGVLTGAETDIVSGAFGGPINRTSNYSINAGYSRNHGFLVGDATISQTFDYWYTGASYTKTIGRNVDLFLNYQLQYQTSGTGGCVGAGCSQDTLRNQISFGVNLHKQPIPF